MHSTCDALVLPDIQCVFPLMCSLSNSRGLSTSGGWSFTLEVDTQRQDLVGHGYVMDAVSFLECPPGCEPYVVPHVVSWRDGHHPHGNVG